MGGGNRQGRTGRHAGSLSLFRFDDARHAARASAILRRLPALSGAPIRIQNAHGLGTRRGPVHAGSFLRERRIAFDCTRAEFSRIFAHEVAHFVWLRLGNPRRHRYEELLRAEFAARASGELGWSAERRKLALESRDRLSRSRAWREYCCESFCDTAAWLWSGLPRHAEFTLPAKDRSRRARWFRDVLAARPLSI